MVLKIKDRHDPPLLKAFQMAQPSRTFHDTQKINSCFGVVLILAVSECEGITKSTPAYMQPLAPPSAFSLLSGCATPSAVSIGWSPPLSAGCATPSKVLLFCCTGPVSATTPSASSCNVKMHASQVCASWNCYPEDLHVYSTFFYRTHIRKVIFTCLESLV